MASVLKGALRVLVYAAAAFLTLLGGAVLGVVVNGHGTALGGVVGGLVLLSGLGLGYLAFAQRSPR